MIKRKIASFVLGVYALSLLASAIAVQPVQAAPAQADREVLMTDLDVTASSSAGGVVNPGDTITYTVTVKNNGAAPQNNLVITAPLPSGTTYVPQSTTLTYPSAPIVHTYRDEFSALSYSNSDGTDDWSKDLWAEVKDEGGIGHSLGNIRIINTTTNGVLRFDGNVSGGASYLERSAPVPVASTATVSFDYKVNGVLETQEDIFKVIIFNGSSYTSTNILSGEPPYSGTYTSENIQVLGNSLKIRFSIQGFNGEIGDLAEWIEIDNVQLAYSVPGPVVNKDNITDGVYPDLKSGFPETLIELADEVDLAAGGTLTLTYQVVVDDPVASEISEIASTVEVVSAEQPIPLIATATDRLRGVYLTALNTASISSVSETGGSVTFTYTVSNDGIDPVTIDSLVDDHFGPLDGSASCKMGTILAAGASCTFDSSFSIPSGDAGLSHINTFTVTGSDGFGNTGGTNASETVTYTDAPPDISVMMDAKSETVAEIGGTITYTFMVVNNSVEPVWINALSDDVFGVLSGDSDCQVNTKLAGKASCSFEAAFSIPAGEADGTRTNVFTAEVVDNEGNVITVQDSETILYTNVMPDVSVSKTAAVETVMDAGENVTFTFTVFNNSAEAAEITALTDDKFGTLLGEEDCKVSTVLQGGSSCSFESVLAIPAGLVGTTHVNEFTASAADNEGFSDSGSDSETITYVETPAPALTVHYKVFADEIWWDADTAPGPRVLSGQEPQFRFTVRNTGNVLLTNILLLDPLSSTSSCFIPESLTPNDGVEGSGGDEFSCTFTAAWSAGSQTSTITVGARYSTRIITASDDASYTGVYTSDLVVTQTNIGDTYTPGEQLNFTIVVTNNGPDDVTGAIFNDAISAQVSSWTWACTMAGGASGCGEVTGSSASFEDTIDLPVGGSVIYAVTAVTLPSALTSLTNTASISTPTGTDDADPVNNSDSVTATASPRANLSITKAADSKFRPGENLAYTITVTNAGPSDAASVIVTDVLPDEVTFVSASPAVSSSPGPVQWNLGTFAAGEVCTIHLVVRVKESIYKPFINTAAVTTTTAEAVSADNSQSAVAEPENPNPVTLLYLRATPADGLEVLVEWKAETEVALSGYKLYRGVTTVFQEAVELPAFVEPNGAKIYTYTDTVPSTGSYHYWLVDVTIYGDESLHGPVLAVINRQHLYLPLMGR